MRPKLELLISPGFVLALALLLVNDFVLKSAWPGFVTGKLSDFAGLWVFALFCAALLPRRAPPIYVVIAIAWVLWKSPASQPAIDAWNGTLPLDIARVVDYGDLAALAVLPASYAYFARLRDVAVAPPTLVRRSASALVLVASVFAFGATSSEYDAYDVEPRDGVYYFVAEPQSVVHRLNELALDYEGKTFDPYIDYRKSYWISVPSEFCGTHFDAEVEFLDTYRTGTKATLQHIEHECERDSDDIEELQEIFEREIIDPLGGRATPREALEANPGFDESAPFVSPPQLSSTPGPAEGDVTPIPPGARQVIIYDQLVNGSVTHEVNGTAPEVIERINSLGLEARGVEFAPVLPGGSRVLTMELRSELCPPSVTTRVLVRELPPSRTEIFLLEVQHDCTALAGDRALYLAEFQRDFIEQLRTP